MSTGSNVFSILPRYLICVDENKSGFLRGRIYVGKTEYDGKEFGDLPELLVFVDDLCDALKSPMNWTEKRGEHGESRRASDAKNTGEILSAMRKLSESKERGKKATFILDIKLRKFSSWQGEVHCLESGNAGEFQSELEFIRFVENECKKLNELP